MKTHSSLCLSTQFPSCVKTCQTQFCGPSNERSRVNAVCVEPEGLQAHCFCTMHHSTTHRCVLLLLLCGRVRLRSCSEAMLWHSLVVACGSPPFGMKTGCWWTTLCFVPVSIRTHLTHFLAPLLLKEVTALPLVFLEANYACPTSLINGGCLTCFCSCAPKCDLVLHIIELPKMSNN